MANTYTQIFIQIVFGTAGHTKSIPSQLNEELQKYTTGIVQNRNHKMLAVNNMMDHIHILIGYNPTQPLPDLVRDIKRNSSCFINEHAYRTGKFAWQKGYGAFSYSRSQIPLVIRYIENQTLHHRRKTFQEEYLEMLEKFGVAYNPEFVLDKRIDSEGDEK